MPSDLPGARSEIRVAAGLKVAAVARPKAALGGRGGGNSRGPSPEGEDRRGDVPTGRARRQREERMRLTATRRRCSWPGP
ncbi:unnamed protein product, partial [Ixodes persulcatus]